MAHVVCQACVDCRYTDCVVVCPVDCFREGPRQLFIDPELCIDCEICVPECPVEAIFRDLDVPQDQRLEIERNARESRLCPPIVERQEPLDGKPRPPPDDAT